MFEPRRTDCAALLHPSLRVEGRVLTYVLMVAVPLLETMLAVLSVVVERTGGGLDVGSTKVASENVGL